MSKIVNTSDIQQNLLEIQNILFRKGTKQEALDHLLKNNIKFDDLIMTLFAEDDEKKIDLLISLFELLYKFEGFSDDIVNLIIKQSQINKSNLFTMNSVGAKKYFIKIIKLNSDKLINLPFMNEFFKIYLMDKSSGVYTQTLQLIIYLIKNNLILTERLGNLIQDLVQYFETLIINSDSIYLVRKFEIYICFIDHIYKNEFFNKENNTTWIKLKEGVGNICKNFYQYDILTQLSLLETIESNINDQDVLLLLEPNKNFYNDNIMSLDAQTMRKLLLTFSKFYARYLINDKDIRLLKNTLAISFQYYNDDKNIQFICYLLNNIFNNTHIYGFIMDSANNSQFDFLNNIIDVMSTIFIINDPVIKVEIYEALERLFDFGEDEKEEEESQKNPDIIPFLGKQNLSQHKQFIILLLTEIIKKTSLDDFVKSKTEDEIKGKFFEYLYEHFKKNDLPDYELCFLRLIYYIVSDDDNTKSLLSNFDFVIYLLKRRKDRPPEVCEAKYKVIKRINNKKQIISQMSKEFSQQFMDYVNKGPY